MLTVSDVIAPDAISDEQLREFHTKEYLGSLKVNMQVIRTHLCMKMCCC